MNKNKLILSTCWYSVGAKFNDEVYHSWMDNMLSNVVKYFVVIYTDDNSYFGLIHKYGYNPNIKFVLLPFNEFIGYKTFGEKFWKENHDRNKWLNQLVHWEVNMIWCEKVHFVEKTCENCFFKENPHETWYGWIDIGYFRCRPGFDISREYLQHIPGKMNSFSREKINYLLVNKNKIQMDYLKNLVQNEKSLPPNQVSFGGGCFIAFGDDLIKQWSKYFSQIMKEKYLDKGLVIKDDQIIIATCIFLNSEMFDIHISPQTITLDPWFYFTHLLL
jgi:hypothetical protein